jgi:hypothetical protein
MTDPTPPTLDESRPLLAEHVDAVEFVWPDGVEEIPNEFQTPEHLRYEDDEEIT